MRLPPIAAMLICLLIQIVLAAPPPKRPGIPEHDHGPVWGSDPTISSHSPLHDRIPVSDEEFEAFLNSLSRDALPDIDGNGAHVTHSTAAQPERDRHHEGQQWQPAQHDIPSSSSAALPQHHPQTIVQRSQHQPLLATAAPPLSSNVDDRPSSSHNPFPPFPSFISSTTSLAEKIRPLLSQNELIARSQFYDLHDWQRRLEAYEIEEIYTSVKPLWGDWSISTINRCLARLKKRLTIESALQILGGNKALTKEIALYTGPRAAINNVFGGIDLKKKGVKEEGGVSQTYLGKWGGVNLEKNQKTTILNVLKKHLGTSHNTLHARLKYRGLSKQDVKDLLGDDPLVVLAAAKRYRARPYRKTHVRKDFVHLTIQEGAQGHSRPEVSSADERAL